MAANIELLQMSDTMTEGTVLTWLKEEGDEVREGDPIAEIETDKATMDVEAPQDGILLKRFVDAGVTVPCGTLLAVVGEKGEPVPEAAPTPSAEKTATEAASAPDRAAQAMASPGAADERRIRSSPAARKLARARGVDMGDLVGSGPAGRIVRRDVEAAAASSGDRPARGDEAAGAVSRARRKMIEHLVAAHQSVPTFTISRRIRMDAAHALREALKATNTFAEGIGYTEVLVKAAAGAMREVPGLNARYAEGGIRLFDDVNVGIAVGLEEAVVVPVIRRCQAKSLLTIRDEFRRLTEQANDGTLLADDLGNSTFTISNLGMYGVEEFTAILNAPDAAILAVGAIAPQPVVDGGKVAVAKMMAVTLTVDHRVADGVLAARWLQAFVRLVENPISLVLDTR